MESQIIAQAIGIVAMFFNIFSYQQKSAKGVIAFQLFGGLFFSVNFLMIGAYSGGLLNLVAVIRALLFLKKEKFHTDRWYWLIAFTLVYLVSYVMTFTVFSKELTVLSAIMEFLPVIGMVATTLAFRHSEAKVIRRFGFASSGCWLIYNIYAFSVGAIICEAFSIISIIIGILRLDKKTDP